MSARKPAPELDQEKKSAAASPPSADNPGGGEAPAEYASPPCYARDFPGYFGEDAIEAQAPAPAPAAAPPCRQPDAEETPAPGNTARAKDRPA